MNRLICMEEKLQIIHLEAGSVPTFWPCTRGACSYAANVYTEWISEHNLCRWSVQNVFICSTSHCLTSAWTSPGQIYSKSSHSPSPHFPPTCLPWQLSGSSKQFSQGNQSLLHPERNTAHSVRWLNETWLRQTMCSHVSRIRLFAPGTCS